MRTITCTNSAALDPAMLMFSSLGGIYWLQSSRSYERILVKFNLPSMIHYRLML